MSELLLDTAWWVPMYGLLGALLTLPWSVGLIRRTGQRPAAYINVLMTAIALIHGFLILQHIWTRPPLQQVIPWLDVLDLHLDLVFDLSPVSVGAAVLITGLSLLAQIFALGYLEKDWSLARFYGLMGFFEGAMSGLVLSDSLFFSYALLEMLTLSTYLLVGFWYAQPLVVTAARDAFLTKRVGDLMLLMGVVAVATFCGSLTFSDLADWAASVDLAPWLAALIGLAMIGGPIGKCAQFPLHVWLDEAMEGPNPASILRNSVVVACGAYVLIKLEPLLDLSPLVSVFLIATGSLTAIGASLIALAQVDIKRTFSYSTSAYLGLVFVAVGMQQPDLALEFLGTHALAKALLFMGVGAVIMTTVSQDITHLGGLRSRMPATTAAFLVGSAGMVAVVPLGSFWVMLRMVEMYWVTQPGLVPLVLLVNGLTAFNLTRVYGLVFEGPIQPKTRRAPEVFWPMAVPMVFLAGLTVHVPLFQSWWHLLPEWTPRVQILALLLVLSGVLGVGIAAARYLFRTHPPAPIPLTGLQDLLAHDFYMDRLYQLLVVQPFRWGAAWIEWIDRYLVDGLVNGVSLVLLIGAESLKYSVSGRMQLYLLTIVLGTILVIALLLQSLITGPPILPS